MDKEVWTGAKTKDLEYVWFIKTVHPNFHERTRIKNWLAEQAYKFRGKGRPGWATDEWVSHCKGIFHWYDNAAALDEAYFFLDTITQKPGC